MKSLKNTPLSVLDLSPILVDGTPADAFHRSLDLAQHAEKRGYNRYWLAEHHSMPGIASAATSVVIGYVAGGTSTIRVGSGGIMLPNHAPLVIAEQFGTLASLYPGRIDLVWVVHQVRIRRRRGPCVARSAMMAANSRGS